MITVNVVQHDPCSISSDCASNLECISNICDCSSSTAFWNGTYCGKLNIFVRYVSNNLFDLFKLLQR